MGGRPAGSARRHGGARTSLRRRRSAARGIVLTGKAWSVAGADVKGGVRFGVACPDPARVASESGLRWMVVPEDVGTTPAVEETGPGRLPLGAASGIRPPRADMPGPVTSGHRRPGAWSAAGQVVRVRGSLPTNGAASSVGPTSESCDGMTVTGPGVWPMAQWPDPASPSGPGPSRWAPPRRRRPPRSHWRCRHGASWMFRQPPVVAEAPRGAHPGPLSMLDGSWWRPTHSAARIPWLDAFGSTGFVPGAVSLLIGGPRRTRDRPGVRRMVRETTGLGPTMVPGMSPALGLVVVRGLGTPTGSVAARCSAPAAWPDTTRRSAGPALRQGGARPPDRP